MNCLKKHEQKPTKDWRLLDAKDGLGICQRSTARSHGCGLGISSVDSNWYCYHLVLTFLGEELIL